jgi:hypothetical protein
MHTVCWWHISRVIRFYKKLAINIKTRVIRSWQLISAEWFYTRVIRFSIFARHFYIPKRVNFIGNAAFCFWKFTMPRPPFTLGLQMSSQAARDCFGSSCSCLHRHCLKILSNWFVLCLSPVICNWTSLFSFFNIIMLGGFCLTVLGFKNNYRQCILFV